MRNPNRIPSLSWLFTTYWMTVGPDLRFGQVLELMAQDYAECHQCPKPCDFFYIEDERWAEALDYGLNKRGVAIGD